MFLIVLQQNGKVRGPGCVPGVPVNIFASGFAEVSNDFREFGCLVVGVHDVTFSLMWLS